MKENQKKIVILHTGLPKSSSTSLQRRFADFPGNVAKPFPERWEIGRRLTNDENLRIIEKNLAGKNKIICSDERMTWGTDECKQYAQNIVKLLETNGYFAIEVRVRRSPVDLLVSLYHFDHSMRAYGAKGFLSHLRRTAPLFLDSMDLEHSYLENSINIPMSDCLATYFNQILLHFHFNFKIKSLSQMRKRRVRYAKIPGMLKINHFYDEILKKEILIDPQVSGLQKSWEDWNNSFKLKIE